MSEQKEASRELDAKVAELVMGCIVNRSHRGGWGTFDAKGQRVYIAGSPDAKVPEFSWSIEAAFSLVEAMRAKGWFVEFEADEHEPHWYVCFWERFKRRDRQSVRDDSLPLAICLAALKAIEASTSQKQQLAVSPDTQHQEK